MVTQDNFKGVSVESWPVDGVTHRVALPSVGHAVVPSPFVAKSNLGGLMDRSLFHEFIREAEYRLDRPVLAVDVAIKCDHIERHTAEFHLEAGRDYLRKHPNLKRSVATEVKIFWRTIYLVSGTEKFAIARTNWKETTFYRVGADREFTFASRVVEPMQGIMRHPFLLPMGSPTNTVFTARAKQAIVPVTDSWHPDGVSIPEFIKETNELMNADFCTMPTHQDYDLYVALARQLGIKEPHIERKEHPTITGQGKGIVNRIKRQYNKPVFQTRGASYVAASRYAGFDKEHGDQIDTWELCFRVQLDGFIPLLGEDIAKRILVTRPGDNSAWLYGPQGDGGETNYTIPLPFGTEPSARLASNTHGDLNAEWRKEVARLTTIVEQQK